MENLERLKKERSRFVIHTGPRGSTKSLLLTSNQIIKLLQYHYINYYLGTNKKVWSNYPVEFYHKSKIDGKIVHLEALPLNREAFMLFDEEYCEGWVFIDEIDQWYDRQDWQNGDQKVTNKGLTQIRKIGLSIGATVQDMDWLNPRLQFQIDVQVECRDASFLPWGKKCHLAEGEASSLTWKDLSGRETGYTFKETGQVYRNTFWGKRFWHCYDTNFKFDPTESMTRYKVKRKVKEISFDDGEDVKGVLPGNKIDPKEVLFADIIHQFKENGQSEVSRTELQMMANENGYTGDWTEAGRILSRLELK